MGYVFRRTLKKLHMLLNLVTRGCPWVKFKLRHASTLGEGHLSQRWRILYPMRTHNIFFQKKIHQSKSYDTWTWTLNDAAIFISLQCFCQFYRYHVWNLFLGVEERRNVQKEFIAAASASLSTNNSQKEVFRGVSYLKCFVDFVYYNVDHFSI